MLQRLQRFCISFYHRITHKSDVISTSSTPYVEDGQSSRGTMERSQARLDAIGVSCDSVDVAPQTNGTMERVSAQVGNALHNPDTQQEAAEACAHQGVTMKRYISVASSNTAMMERAESQSNLETSNASGARHEAAPITNAPPQKPPRATQKTQLVDGVAPSDPPMRTKSMRQKRTTNAQSHVVRVASPEESSFSRRERLRRSAHKKCILNIDQKKQAAKTQVMQATIIDDIEMSKDGVQKNLRFYTDSLRVAMNAMKEKIKELGEDENDQHQQAAFCGMYLAFEASVLTASRFVQLLNSNTALQQMIIGSDVRSCTQEFGQVYTEACNLLMQYRAQHDKFCMSLYGKMECAKVDTLKALCGVIFDPDVSNTCPDSGFETLCRVQCAKERGYPLSILSEVREVRGALLSVDEYTLV